MSRIALTTGELRRLDVMQRLVRGQINGTEAARILQCTVRHIKRIKVRYLRHGVIGLRHGNVGQLSNRALPSPVQDHIATLIKKHYPDFGPTLAQEKLTQLHGIQHDVKTIRAIMLTHGLWKPKTTRQNGTHRVWRLRRPAYGEMVQFDGCYHPWFEDRAGVSCLLLAVDDATSTIPQGAFDQHEGVRPVFAFWQAYVTQIGVPVSIYLDKFSTYKMNSAVAQDNHDLKTQFQRAMTSLGVEVIFAHSPQAKGRVENKFKTLQDRLVKELRLAGVSDTVQGNLLLQQKFIPAFNKQFGVPPRTLHNLHRLLTPKELNNLTSIFSIQFERVVHNDWTISYRKQWYQLAAKQPVTVQKRDTVTVEDWLDQTIHFKLRGKYLNAKPIPKRPDSSTHTPWVLPGTLT
jgi:hypothetical protein